jgi:hypothetical protein
MTRVVLLVGLLLASAFLIACKAHNSSAPSIRQEPARISEITLIQWGCLGTCPRYAVTFQKNGCAIYDGFGYVPLSGHYVGTIYSDDFSRLSNLVSSARFFGMQQYYGNFHVFDIAHSVLSVVSKGARKTVRVAYSNMKGDVEPLGYFELVGVIDGIVFTTKWFGKDLKQPYRGFEQVLPDKDCLWSRSVPYSEVLGVRQFRPLHP